MLENYCVRFSLFEIPGQGIAGEGATMLAAAIAPSRMLTKLSIYSTRRKLASVHQFLRHQKFIPANF